MAMDVKKKARLEQRAVLGLLVLFAVVFTTGPLKSLGVFKQKPSTPTPAAPTGRVDLSRPLSDAFQQHWKQLEPESNPARPQASRPEAAAPLSKPVYTAQGLRDPLKSLLPTSPSRAPAEGPPAAQHEAVPEPEPLDPSMFAVQGTVWGGPTPKAIMNGAVYAVGDQVQGATITSIGRDGVMISYAGATVLIPVSANQMGSRGSSRTPR